MTDQAKADILGGADIAGLKKSASSQTRAFIVMLILLCVGPWIFYPVFLMKVLCFAMFACGFNLLLGYAGMMSFGHAAFFGMGSYIAAWTGLYWHWPIELSLSAAGAVALGLGLVFGRVSILRQGVYFSMITLALAEMVYFFCLQAPFTHGEDGIQPVPRGVLFGVLPLQSNITMYYVVAVIFLVSFLAIQRVVYSPYGQVLRAIRDNEPRATSLGFPTVNYKLAAFVISAFFAGIAGGTKAFVFGVASLTDVHFSMSGFVVLMTLVGGVRTIYGPVVGAFMLVAMENYFGALGDLVTVAQGIIFVLCVLLFRLGIVGQIEARFKIQL